MGKEHIKFILNEYTFKGLDKLRTNGYISLDEERRLEKEINQSLKIGGQK